MIKIKKLINLKEYLKASELCEYNIIFNNKNGILAKINFRDYEYDFRMLEIFDGKIYDLEFSLDGNYEVTNTNKNPIKLFNTISYLVKIFIETNNPNGIYFSSDNNHLKFYNFITNKIKNLTGYNFSKIIMNEKTWFIFSKDNTEYENILNYLHTRHNEEDWDEEDDY